MFDSRARDGYGRSHPLGTCVLVEVPFIQGSVQYFQAIHALAGLEKTPVRSSRTSRFFPQASKFLSLLAPRARAQTRRSPTQFLITILRRKGKF